MSGTFISYGLQFSRLLKTREQIHSAYVSLMYKISDVLNHRLRRARSQTKEVKSVVRRKFCAWELHWPILHYCDPNKRTIPNKAGTETVAHSRNVYTTSVTLTT